MGKSYDVIIVGGGITGASLLYMLSSYTNIKSVLLIEKYGELAPLNSKNTNNAQTLHFGDIETNYSIAEATRTKRAAQMLVRYIDALPEHERRGLVARCQKMVLGVDDFELEILDRIYYSRIKELFPNLKYIKKEQIARLEPNVAKGRDPEQKIAALLSDNGRMVDFGRLTRSFAKKAKENRRAKIEITLDTKVNQIKEVGDHYEIYTSRGMFTADFVACAAGTYSLYFAKSLGYNENLSILSIGGNFYYSKNVLRGKVYRVQIGGIPFAAVHGDPDIANKGITRFGPTVTLPFGLEKGHGGTFLDYVRTFDLDLATLQSLMNIFANKDIRRIIARNVLYDMPLVGKREFLKKEVSYIVPSLKLGDLKMGRDIGGIRPQIIDENKKSLVLGAGKIKGDGIIFNITPSPGASSCIASSMEDSMYIAEYLGREFNSELFDKRIGHGL
ncbi:MAG: FAD-dependent oxidoreductase [Candidatus Micrarchaeota archaeon]|nr:FAD-dependent oxidoreductase [Candidatus Micrarchaeota archaeon]